MARARPSRTARAGRRQDGAPPVLAHHAGGTSSGRHAQTYDTRVQSKIRSLANLAAARATCRLAAAARRSQARRGAQPTQDAGLHPWPRLCPAHGRLAARIRGRRVVVEDPGVRPPDGGQAAADDARPRPPEHAAPAAVRGSSSRTQVPQSIASGSIPGVKLVCVFPPHNMRTCQTVSYTHLTLPTKA